MAKKKSNSTQENTFEKTDSGASKTYPIEAGNLKKGGYVCIKNNPCKITDILISGTGKHGGTRVRLIAKDIFTDKKYEHLCPGDHQLQVPYVNREEYSLVHINDDGFLELLKSDNSLKSDLKLPEGELGERIVSKFNEGKSLIIGVLSAMNEERIVSVKEET